MSQLTCRELSLGYEGKEIISNLSFHVNAGDYLCIVGENGSGKSTLMKTILGLRKPMKGEIITGDGLRSREIGYLPQQTVVQKDFPASVKEIVLSGFQGRCGLRPFYTKAEKRVAMENIRKMGIEDLKNRCYRVTASFRAVSSSAFFWRAHSVRRKKCCFWTSLSRDLTQSSRLICTALSNLSTRTRASQ